MLEAIAIKTEKYEFYFYLGKDARGRAQSVIVNVATIERRDFTKKDENEVRSIIEDMGKWEAFVKTGKSLLQDLGINVKGEKEYEKEFGIEKYETELERKENRIRVTIKLTPTESFRRSGGALPIKEIVEQIENVPKWKMLKKVISELKKHGIPKGN